MQRVTTIGLAAALVRAATALLDKLRPAVFVFVLLLLACDRGSSQYDGPYARLVAKYVPRIEKETGLRFKTPPRLETRSSQEVASFVRQQLESDRAKAQIEGQQAAYRLLGLIPDTMHLGDLLQRVLEEQIVGYYDPATKVLYVVDGAPEALIDQTVSHELVHALQDQYVNIDSIQAAVDNADRQSAARAVLEGQAVLMQMRIDPNTSTMLKMPGGWDRIRDLIRDGSVGMPALASAPRAIREGLLFPYLGGADFVRRFVYQRPESELLSDLPISTHQILDDSAYFVGSAAERGKPITVEQPVPAGTQVLFSNVLGEFETRLILAQHLRSDDLPRRASAGWTGDQLTVVRSVGGDALSWASVWDTTVDAANFLDALAEAMRLRYELARPNIDQGSTQFIINVPARDSTRNRSARIARTLSFQMEPRDGHPVVIFMDYPARASRPLDPARIEVRD